MHPYSSRLWLLLKLSASEDRRNFAGGSILSIMNTEMNTTGLHLKIRAEARFRWTSGKHIHTAHGVFIALVVLILPKSILVFGRYSNLLKFDMPSG